jgi:glyoxylase-like metal-dependent hydrolase (beta-lactamase superfamily II)
VGLAVEIAPGLVRIPTTPLDLVNTFVVRDDDGQVTLIDTGLRGASRRILAGLAEIGVSPPDVTRIVLTHSHLDHTGSVRALTEATGADVAAHADDAEDIRHGRTAPPPGGLGRLLSRAPVGTASPVSEELHDGDVLPVGGGLQVVHTPGHTPGHISLLHPASGTLITGDAIWNMNSRRTWPVLAMCTDPRLTEQTAHRLADLEYSTAAFTHGPEIRGGGREAIREFLARPRPFRLLL